MFYVSEKEVVGVIQMMRGSVDGEVLKTVQFTWYLPGRKYSPAVAGDGLQKSLTMLPRS